MDLTAADDHRHDLKPGEHEAFYFLFASADGKLHGFVRTLFDQDATLELVALHAGDRTWAHQCRASLPPGSASPADASGPSLTMTCLEPWQAWHCRFQAPVVGVDDGALLEADLDLTYAATNGPARYGFGPYQQAQQDGQLSGHVRVGAESWAGELVCYRDHSWGQRPMGAAAHWTVACAPGHFYVVVIQMGDQQLSFGRLTTPDGKSVPVRAPTIAAVDGGWRVEDPEAGLVAWQVRRLAPPLVAYLGVAGQETLRDAPIPGDLYRDDIGPVVFTAPHGDQLVGFLEQARRLE
jgi:hypothetical protein